MNREVARDLGWAALIGVLFGLSPHSGAARIGPSVAIGLVVGVGVFAGRVIWRRRRTAQIGEAESPEAAPLPLFAPPPLSVWLLLACVLLVFLPTLHWLYGEYVFSIWRNGHGLFLPVILWVLSRDRLRADTDAREESSALGAALIAAGATLAAIDAPIHSGLVATFGLIITLPGLSLLMLGARRTRLIAFPLALSIFIMPLPLSLPDTIFLAKGSSLIANEILQLIGVPVVLDQTIFTMKSGTFGVSANCSGIPIFYAALLVSLIGASFTSSWPARAAILLCAWPATVLFNGIRVAVLIGLDNHFGRTLIDTPLHGLSGIGAFWAAIASVGVATLLAAKRAPRRSSA